MKVGDEVRLKPKSDRRQMLGSAADAIGILTATFAGTVNVNCPIIRCSGWACRHRIS